MATPCRQHRRETAPAGHAFDETPALLGRRRDQLAEFAESVRRRRRIAAQTPARHRVPGELAIVEGGPLALCSLPTSTASAVSPNSASAAAKVIEDKVWRMIWRERRA
jgi:hypothetical protein